MQQEVTQKQLSWNLDATKMQIRVGAEAETFLQTGSVLFEGWVGGWVGGVEKLRIKLSQLSTELKLKLSLAKLSVQNKS